MEYVFKFNSDNYDDEALFDMLDSIIRLLSFARPEMTDLAEDFRCQLEQQPKKFTPSRANDKTAIMHLFDKCVRKNSYYDSLKEMCEDIPELGTKAYNVICEDIGGALGPFAYTIHKYQVASWMYQLIDIYKDNWDWDV